MSSSLLRRNLPIFSLESKVTVKHGTRRNSDLVLALMLIHTSAGNYLFIEFYWSCSFTKPSN
jgi:hypothetical protein